MLVSDKSFLSKPRCCGVTTPPSGALAPQLYHPSIAIFSSTSLATCISSVTSFCHLQGLSRVPLSTRAPVQGKSSEREGGKDNAQGKQKEGRAVSEAEDCCRMMLCYHYISSLDEKRTHSKCPLRHPVRLEQCNYWMFCSEASKVGAYLMKLGLYCYSECHFN